MGRSEQTVTDVKGGARIGGRLTVQGWFYLTLALMLLLVVVGTLIGASMLGRTSQVTDDLLRHLEPAQTQAYRLQDAQVNQETGVRGYAIAADGQFLAPYTQGKQDEAHAAARLRDLLADRPDLLADLGAVERAASDWRDGYAEPLASSVTPGRPTTLDAATAGRGKAEFDLVRATWTRQNDGLAQAVADSRARLAHERTVRDSVLIGLVAAFLLTGVALAVLVRFLVARPLEALRTASRRVAGGDFAHVIEPVGPADLAAVADDVEDMRRRIVTELDAARFQEEILARQTADLDAQAVELRRSNTELEQFAYVASHDLQEPLRKIASFCQLLEKRYGDKVDERGRQYIAFAVDGAKRMQVLINDLLTFSRVGRLHDERAAIDLRQAVDKALANLTVAAEEAGARIEVPDELPEVVGDPTLMAMLWQNLLGNALKFRHPDRAPEVTVTCEADPDAEPGAWRLCVTDNGIGIPAEFTEKVFVIFQRLHSRDAYGGTGIGLALCRKIVEHHGGRIWIDTAHAEGARVCFTLPAVESDSDSRSESESGAAAEPGSGAPTEETALT